jgi:hypothetical protein
VTQPPKESVSKGALVLALGQALALWLLHQSIEFRVWPATAPGWLFPAYLISIFLPLTWLLLWSHRLNRTLWWASGALAAFLALAGYLAFSDQPPWNRQNTLDADRIAGFVLPWTVAWLIAVPLLRARLETGTWRTPYGALFRSSWRNGLTLAESVLFTGVFWLLLLLWMALFSTLGIEFFLKVFTDPRFAYPATTLVFAAATRIIGHGDRFIDGVLDQLLGLMKWLLPLAGTIVIAFLIALLPRLPQLIGNGERIINSSILLLLVGATLALFNAAFRDGETEPGYGHLLQHGLRVVPPLLVLIALAALYSMSVRVFDRGLTPSRYWGLMTAVFGLLYSVGYAYASLRSGPWLAAVKQVNVGVAVVLLGTLLVSLTPIADPLRLSVASQLQRALRASTAESRTSALLFLRFNASARGRAALNALVRGDVPDSKAIDIAALRAEASEVAGRGSKENSPTVDPTVTPARYARWRASLKVMPESRTVTPELEEAIRAHFALAASVLDPGGKAPAPQLMFVDLNADGDPECLLLTGTPRGEPQHLRDFVVFHLVDGKWSRWSSGGLR